MKIATIIFGGMRIKIYKVAVIGGDGFNSLVTLFEKITADRLVSLLSVPGATLGRTEQGHNLYKVVEIIIRFKFKIYHKHPPQETHSFLSNPLF